VLPGDSGEGAATLDLVRIGLLRMRLDTCKAAVMDRFDVFDIAHDERDLERDDCHVVISFNHAKRLTQVGVNRPGISTPIYAVVRNRRNQS
jgi:hypothetical protein